MPELGRFAVQVKGGTYEADHSDQWFLRMPDGDRKWVPSPLQEVADGCIELRNGIRKATTFETFVAGVVIFTDMERHEEIEHMARERYHSSVIWGLNGLQQDLERIAEEVDFHRPPSSWVSEKEWRQVYELQYGEASGRRDADRSGARGGTAPGNGRRDGAAGVPGLRDLQHPAPGQVDRAVLPAGAGRGRATPAAGDLAGLRRVGEPSLTGVGIFVPF